MKIIALEAENLKRITAVRIEPDGNLVQITGKNGQGKTSVLDAIWWALAGTSNVQKTPIRNGEETARIRLDLGELIITRKFIAQDDGSYTTSIIVENGEGARFQSPQKMLDDLLGQLTFDPLRFTRQKPAEQVMSLRSLVPDFNFANADALNKQDFEKRTDVNRDLKASLAVVESIGAELPETIPEWFDVQDLINELDVALKTNSDIHEKQQKRNDFILQHDERVAEMIELQSQVEVGKKAIEGWEVLADQIDVDVMRAKMQNVGANNAIAEKAKRQDLNIKSAAEHKEQSDTLTANIDARKEAARKAIAGADLPVSGLDIREGFIYLDDVPFDQASDAQQLQASIAIAMALNPTLKVIRVRDGSLLDEDAMNILAKMADESEYQIWIERVDNSGAVGFVLEDGHIKGQVIEPPKPKEKKAKVEKKPETAAPKNITASEILAREAERNENTGAPKSLFDD